MINENRKISREVNEVLIDRIRKYQSQDMTQLINSPNDEETTNSYLGGLVNFVGDDTYNLDEEINNDLDEITINEIFLEPQPDNDYYDELSEKEEENELKILKNKINENTIKIDLIENNTTIDEISNKIKEENSFINPFVIKKNNTEGIRSLLTENFNKYLDIIGKNYQKYDNNHFPKIIIIEEKTPKRKGPCKIFLFLIYKEIRLIPSKIQVIGNIYLLISLKVKPKAPNILVIVLI